MVGVLEDLKMKKIKLTLTSRRVLTSLYSAFGNPKKSYNALKISTIAGWLNVDPKTVRSNIKLLEDINFITRIPTPKNFKFQINHKLARQFLLKKGTHEAYQALAKKRGKFSIFLVEKQGESSENTLQKFPNSMTKIPEFCDKNSRVSIELNSSLNSIYISSSKSSSLNTFDDDSCVATQAAEIEKLEARYGKALVAKYEKKLQSYKVKHHIKYLQACLANEYTLQEQKLERCESKEPPRVASTPALWQEEYDMAKANFPVMLDLVSKYSFYNVSFDNFIMHFDCHGNNVTLDMTNPNFAEDLTALSMTCLERETAFDFTINFDRFVKKHVKQSLQLVTL